MRVQIIDRQIVHWLTHWLTNAFFHWLVSNLPLYRVGNVNQWILETYLNDKFTTDYMNFFIKLVQNINQHTAKLSIDENDWPTITEVRKNNE